ncbi:MAG: hypothetical protein M3R51_07850 [Candidatus Eremiobacteraeota bacterium]|nr:hypothetical protein [Candidatus Eremiobacteraeota bacterium]
MNEQSPWWYRTRGLIFGLIYMLGFSLGSAMWSMNGRPYESTALWIGTALRMQGAAPLLGIAAACTFLCWALRAWGSAYLHADVVWNADAVTNALVVQGPFRHTRSPLYLGNVFMAVGIGALATPWGFAIIVLGSIAFILRLVRYETQELRAHYGALVDAYVKSVPALLWRISAMTLQGSGHITPSLAQGLRSEIFTACVFAGMTALALFGNRAYPAFTVLLLGGWIAQHLATTRLPYSISPPKA